MEQTRKNNITFWLYMSWIPDMKIYSHIYIYVYIIQMLYIYRYIYITVIGWLQVEFARVSLEGCGWLCSCSSKIYIYNTYIYVYIYKFLLPIISTVKQYIFRVEGFPTNQVYKPGGCWKIYIYMKEIHQNGLLEP